jgi:hypothetical protein
MYAIVLICLGLTIVHLPISAAMLYGSMKAWHIMECELFKKSPLALAPSQLDAAVVLHVGATHSALYHIFCALVEWRHLQRAAHLLCLRIRHVFGH